MKILVIDDDPDILDVVNLCIEMRWPEATISTAKDGKQGLEAYEKQGADLVILDLGLPDMEGLEVCQKLKGHDVPVIMLTVRNQQKDIVRGLETGADDYICKPFDQLELLARIQAIFRRTNVLSNNKEQVFHDGALSINFPTREVKVGGEVVKLTPTEYNLFYQLVTNPGRPMTHKDLLVKVWGPEYLDTPEYLKVHIQHLRRKLSDDSEFPKYIATERGVGYKFIATPSK